MGSLLDAIGRSVGIVIDRWALARRDAPPPYATAFTAGGLGIPAHPKAAEGLKIYQRNPWAYAGTNAIVDTIATTDLFLRRRTTQEDGSVGYEPVLEHQALELIANPIPKEGPLSGRSYLTKTLLKQITWVHLIGAGEAFWAVGGRAGAFTGFEGVPTELHPLVPDAMEVILGRDNFVEQYVYRAQGKVWKLQPREVVHFKRPDPRNPYRGQSSYLSSGIALDTDYESDKFLYSWFQNFARPDTAVVTEKPPSVEDQQRIREQFDNRFKGPLNAGKTMFLWGGTDVKDMSKSQRDMQFKELKEFNRDAIMANLRVGKGLLGMMEDQSRANAEAQDYVFGKRVIRPLMVAWCEQLTYDFLPLFGDERSREGLEFWFDEASVVPDDSVTKADVYTKLFAIGAISANEVRTKFNLSPRDDPEADALYFPIAAQPTGGALFGDGEEDGEAEKEFGEPGSEGEEDLKEPDFGEEGADRERAARDPIRIRKAGDLFDERKEVELFRANAEKYGRRGMSVGIGVGKKQTGSKLDDETILDLPNARNALRKLSVRHATETLETTKKDLQRVIDQALREGRSNQELGRAIAKKYGEEYKGYRALRIARTEMTGAVNAGTFEVMRAEGVKYKVWVATRDSRTRETHVLMDDATHTMPVKDADSFHFQSVGSIGDAQYPGDPSLPPGERVNCRCTMVSSDFLGSNREQRYLKRFLKGQGSVEKAFARTLRGAFDAQRERVLSKLK